MQYYCHPCDKAFEAQAPDGRLDIGPLLPEANDALSLALNLSGSCCPTCGRKGRAVNSLSKFTLQDRREHIQQKVNEPLLRLLLLIAKRIGVIPRPENCKRPETAVFLRLKEKFKKHQLQARADVLEAIWDIFVYKEEVDSFYAERIFAGLEWWLDEVLEGNWPIRKDGYPLDKFWIQDQRGSGHAFIKAMQKPEIRQQIKQLITEV